MLCWDNLVVLLHSRCSVETGQQFPSVVFERRSVRRTAWQGSIVAQYDLQEPKGVGDIGSTYCL